MSCENITKDMFNALDYEKKGCVSKQHLITQMSDYLSENCIGDDTMSKISFLNKYPDFIDYEDFKQIYLDLTESNSLSLYDEEDEDVLICSMYEEIIGNNGSDSDVYDDFGSQLDLDGSRIHDGVIDMSKKRTSRGQGTIISQNKRTVVSNICQNELNKSDYQTEIGGLCRLSARSSVAYPLIVLGNFAEDIDELSYMTDSGMSIAAEEVDKLTESYKSVVNELCDLKYKLEDSTKKYVHQREVTKMHNDRILLLEDQIHHLENLQQDQMDIERKEKMSMKNLNLQRSELEKEEQIQNAEIFRQEVLTRLNTLESEYNASNEEFERMKKECSVLIKKKGKIEKQLKLSNKRCNDLELTLQDFKISVGLQIAELQNERDNVEKINKELYDKLQDTRLTYKCKNSHYSTSLTSPVQSRTLSWTGPFNFISTSTNGSKTSLESGRDVSSSQSCTTISQLERVVHCLTMDNRNLVEKVSHLETLEFYQRQRINVSNNMSFASEIEQLSVTDLTNALTTEKETARRLQLYIMGLTNRLMLAGYIEAFRHN